MSMVERKFGPVDIELFADISPPVLRGYRHRKLLKGFGEEQANGRWLYSGYEVLTMALGIQLEKAGVDLKFAFWMGWTVAGDVANAIRGVGESSASNQWAFWTIDAGQPRIEIAGWELQWSKIHDLSQISEIGATSVQILNRDALASQITSEFAEFIRGTAD